ncbi:Bax inhibitor-1/YccA family membrane protein [Plantactinospora sp. CA-294935]|uniref:Bax inhibitor-1/YccA family membrane protein n=1 Tax=Plantactinospora sp. CA-294935 TaxID=3240012 RepID=UPI003D8DAA6F
MALLYGLRVLRASPRFTRLVVGALIGVVVLSLVNLAVYLIAGQQALVVYSTGSKVGWLPYVFALVCITVGALTFILDFDLVQRGVRDGLPARYAWFCAFGLLAGLSSSTGRSSVCSATYAAEPTVDSPRWTRPNPPAPPSRWSASSTCSSAR